MTRQQSKVIPPKNIGHNRWRVVAGQESYNADTYYQAIHLAAHLEFTDSYQNFTKKNETHKKIVQANTLGAEKSLITTSWIAGQPATANFNSDIFCFESAIRNNLLLCF